ncbi:50S ribosomal protein L18 [Candidatus Calescamantes bacterium]|nr:50S ribosomal protein L18 [Candidatus Calescamantes bacterium]
MARGKEERRKRRHLRIRKKIFGTKERPRLAVFRSQKHIYAQLVDDEEGKVLLAVSSLSPEFKKEKAKGQNIEGAKLVGKLLAQKAVKKKILQVAFDRGGYKYQGRVRALAEEARKGGLKF